MRLSSNFTLEELIATNTHIDNKPSNIQMSKLLYAAIYLLQPIANKFGKIKIFSKDRQFQDINHLYPSGGTHLQFTDNNTVIHSEIKKEIGKIEINILENWLENASEKEPLIKWKVFADNMKFRESSSFIRDIFK